MSAAPADQRDKVDIAEPLKTIARRLGVRYENVFRFTIEPDSVELLFWQENENGRKHVNLHTGYAVMGRKTIRVKT